MSYEGYEVWLCASGHRHDYDCYHTPDRSDWACPDCRLPLAWWCSVDETNCDPKPPRLKIDKPQQTERCAHCGVARVTAKETYVIPKRKAAT